MLWNQESRSHQEHWSCKIKWWIK